MIEDFFYPFKRFYDKAPQPIANLMGTVYNCIPLSLRYGPTYNYYKQLLKESSYWNDEMKERFILKNLKKTFINAYEHTNYYKNLFDSIGFNPYNFNDVKSITDIPFSDKLIIRENKSSLINNSIPKSRLIYTTTGGTTGVPVEVYLQKGVERSREFAFMMNQWSRVGYKFGDRIVRIRGNVINPKKPDILYKYEPIKNRLLLSTYHLSDKTFAFFIQKINEFKPKFIHTYPSAIMPLSKYILKNNVKIISPTAIFCSSEQFYPGQREIIEESFKTRIYSWYGHTENTTLAGECEYNHDYHVFFEYGYLELVDENGKIITEANIKGEIVGTSFEMKGFPIIRYRTGDFAEYSDNECTCGRNYKLIKNVQGRWTQEQIITKALSGISMTALNMHTNIFDNVVQYQFFQDEIGKVQLKILRGLDFSKKDEINIYKSFKEKFKDLVDLKIIYVEKIENTLIGKQRFLVQKLDTSLIQ